MHPIFWLQVAKHAYLFPTMYNYHFTFLLKIFLIPINLWFSNWFNLLFKFFNNNLTLILYTYFLYTLLRHFFCDRWIKMSRALYLTIKKVYLYIMRMTNLIIQTTKKKRFEMRLPVFFTLGNLFYCDDIIWHSNFISTYQTTLLTAWETLHRLWQGYHDLFSTKN